MNNLELIKAIFHSAGFYWKKFFVLSLFMVTILGGVFYWRSAQVSEASFQFSEVAQYQSFGEKKIDVIIKSNGQVLVDGKDQSKSLKLYSDRDELRLLLLDNEGIFIENLKVTVHLPQAVPANQLEQVTYAIHGVGSYRNYIQDQKTVVYQASNIASQSTLTILLKFPKDMIQPPLSKTALYYISVVPAQSYLIFAVVLPILTLLLVLFMLVKRRKDQIISLNVAPSSQPPAAVLPAVAGVLVDGQVGSREIAATLISLATRGYIHIVRKGENFTFGKRKSMPYEEMPELKLFEKILLSKIFMPTNYRSTREDVEMRVGHHIFSRKMAQVYLGIYNEATASGYFVKNPARVHAAWKYTGIVFFFLSILGFAQSAFYAPDPKFTLLFWVGSMAAAAVIIKTSGLMPARSAAGSQALTPWMAFRKFLKLHQPIQRGANNQNLFIQYLPYAIVFGVEDVWAMRFMQENFTKPDWYESQELTITLDEFIGGLYPLIAFVGDILAQSHEPTVE